MKYILFIFLFSIGSIGCSSIEKVDTSSPEGAFIMAERYEKVERYEEAISRYNELRTKFPYSKHAVEAQLRIADIQFKRQYYLEAASAYQIFHEYYPRHPKSEFILYRIGLSYFHQLPKTVDRDLTASNEALYAFNDYVAKYPKGQHSKEINEKRQATINMLVEKEMYVGDYYLKQKQYMSALGRYQHVYDTYSNSDLARDAAYKALVCAIELDYRDFAKRFYDILAKKYSSSEEFKEAKVLGKKYGIL